MATDYVVHLDSTCIFDHQAVVLDLAVEKDLIYFSTLLNLVEAKHFFDRNNVRLLAVHVEVLVVYHRRVWLFAVVEGELLDDLQAMRLLLFTIFFAFRGVKRFEWIIQDFSQQVIKSAQQYGFLVGGALVLRMFAVCHNQFFKYVSFSTRLISTRTSRWHRLCFVA